MELGHNVFKNIYFPLSPKALLLSQKMQNVLPAINCNHCFAKIQTDSVKIVEKRLISQTQTKLNFHNDQLNTEQP